MRANVFPDAFGGQLEHGQGLGAGFKVGERHGYLSGSLPLNVLSADSLTGPAAALMAPSAGRRAWVAIRPATGILPGTFESTSGSTCCAHCGRYLLIGPDDGVKGCAMGLFSKTWPMRPTRLSGSWRYLVFTRSQSFCAS